MSLITKIKVLFRTRLTTFSIGVFIVVFGFIFTFQFVEPAPPKTLTIATGNHTLAYYSFAKRYAKLLKEQGITLNVVETKGSVDNLKLLSDKSSKVDIAFVQGGIKTENKKLATLGSMYYEPLWVFHRADITVNYLTELAGKKIAIGAKKSGTKALAISILKKNGIDAKVSQWLTIPSEEAAKKLLAGEVDVMFMVASPKAPLLKKLLRSRKITIMSFKRAYAYERVFPSLSVLKLPEGAIDFKENIPNKEITLLTTTANLVASEDLHPALVGLFLHAATKTHEKLGLFERSGQFPTPKYISLPLNKDAKRYYKYGTPFLQRYLPFWLANMLDRLKIMLLPMIVLLIPLFKVFPPLYRWMMRKRIYSWYSELRSVDPELVEVDANKLVLFLAKLEKLEEDLSQVNVPLSYADEVYNLRLHIEMVRDKLGALEL